jgi:hypothetical protein
VETAAAITEGRVFRAINKAWRIWGDGMSPKVLWDVVRATAAHAGIATLGPHDLRRTCVQPALVSRIGRFPGNPTLYGICNEIRIA